MTIIENAMTRHQALTPVSDDKQRTIDQNKQQWPYLQAFSRQKKWPVNGVLRLMTPDSWKHVLTAGFIKYMIAAGETEAAMVRKYLTQNIAMGFAINAPENYDQFGTVMMGYHTRQFTEELWPHWMQFLRVAADECEIKVPISKRQAALYQL